jgi:glutamine synthetase
VHADAAPFDRGAALRICPLFTTDPAQRARQFNLEFRVADATASPYLALAVLVQAGLEGIRARREIELARPKPLPASLIASLDLLEATPEAADWMGAGFLSAYLGCKRAEAASLEQFDEHEVCRRYAAAY